MGGVLGGGSSINVSTWFVDTELLGLLCVEWGDPSWGHEAVLDLHCRRIEAWVEA